MSATITHAETYALVTKWGSYGTGDGQFHGPGGIATDSSGNIYVADIGNNRIQKFDSNGNFITKWGSYGSNEGQFVSQESVAVDSSGNVYVPDSYNNRIQKFDSNGNFITQWGSHGTGDGQLSIPLYVAIDSAGNVYVTDLAATTSGWAYPRIQKFDSKGNFISKLGSQGSGDGQFNSPNDIAIDSLDNVYVVDSANHRIQKFDSKGNFITKWGSEGTGDGQFHGANGITVDSSGNVYVTDTGNYRIQKFDSNGKFITKWGSQGIDPDQFEAPWDVAVDSLGNAYVADDANQRIQKFSKAKSTSTIIWSNPVDIAYRTPLSSTQLSATASVPGTFAYNPPAGTILPVGTHTLHVDFTPADTADYSTASKDVKINVLKATPTITWSNPADITYGTKLSVTQLNAKAAVSGTFVYTPPKGTLLSAGTQTLHVDFTPTDTATYNTASKDVTIKVTNVQKTTPQITWNNPADIAYGTKLSSTQLNAKASVSGTFVYTPPAGTILPVSTQTLKVAFTPKDTTKYAIATKTVSINVLTVPLADFSASPTTGKVSLPVTFKDKSTGSPTSYLWDFGDKSTSKDPNPVHTYSKTGSYTVSLMVKNSVGSNSKTMYNYIIVSKK